MHSAAGHMRKNRKITVITALSLIMSVLLTAALSLVIDGELTLKPLAIAAVCALFIAAPIAQFVLTQSEKLEQAHAELMAAHRQLALLHKELENAHQAMEYKAEHDDMTGLVNRAAFLAGLDHMLRGSDRGFVLMIDADRFKRINDTRGHDTGDRVLVAIAEALRAVIRKGDICARIGGEEFAIYLPGSSYQEAYECGERLRRSVASKQIKISTGETIGTTVSIGAAPIEAGQSIDDLMRAADRLLYRAKNEGRNRICIEAPISQAA